jgi:hypothetical protein
VEDVTIELLAEHKHSPGKLANDACRTGIPSKLTDTLADTLRLLQDPRFDPTIGWISNPLLYSRMFRLMSHRDHMNVIRLLKGRFLLVLKRQGDKPSGSRADREEGSHSEHWYEITMNPEKF